MDRKLLICSLASLASLVAGSAATALVMAAVQNSNPQASLAAEAIPVVQTQETLPQTSVFAGMPGMANQAEQRFIVMMIPHHEGAIAMADLALERSQRPEILALAESIKQSQAQENEQMRTWYRQWYGADVPQWTPGQGMMGSNRDGSPWNDAELSPTPVNRPQGMGRGMHRNRGNGPAGMGLSGGQPGMGCMGMGSMNGDLSVLENAPDFDRALIEAMIPHHQMGVMMTQMMVSNSDRPEMQTLAQTIVSTQTAEINQMQQWYQDWYP
jgi:uncharacterized protein (DUF305 family)